MKCYVKSKIIKTSKRRNNNKKVLFHLYCLQCCLGLESCRMIQTFNLEFKLQTMDRNIEIWANNLPRRVCTLEKRLLLC